MKDGDSGRSLFCPIFCTSFIVRVARLFVLIDSRSRGVEMGPDISESTHSIAKDAKDLGFPSLHHPEISLSTPEWIYTTTRFLFQ